MDDKAKKQVPLRLSPKLYAAIAAWAEDDFRSVNGQIEYLLTECVRQRKKNGKYVSDEIDVPPELDIHCKKERTNCPFLFSSGRLGKLLPGLLHLLLRCGLHLIPAAALHGAEHIRLDPVFIVEDVQKGISQLLIDTFAGKGIVAAGNELLGNETVLKDLRVAHILVALIGIGHGFLLLLLQILHQGVVVRPVLAGKVVEVLLDRGIVAKTGHRLVLFHQRLLHADLIFQRGELLARQIRHKNIPLRHVSAPTGAIHSMSGGR